MAELPDVLVWAVLIAVVIQGFSMALLVHLIPHVSKEQGREEKA